MMSVVGSLRLGYTWTAGSLGARRAATWQLPCNFELTGDAQNAAKTVDVWPPGQLLHYRQQAVSFFLPFALAVSFSFSLSVSLPFFCSFFLPLCRSVPLFTDVC